MFKIIKKAFKSIFVSNEDIFTGSDMLKLRDYPYAPNDQKSYDEAMERKRADLEKAVEFDLIMANKRLF